MKILLVDGSALLYRSHFAFARRPLTNRHGEITSAAFGFATALIRMHQEHAADAVLVALDAKGKNFRHEIYPEYKAHRPPMPQDLAAQLPRVRQVIESMELPLFELAGYEADDVLGSLAREGAERGHEMWIYSGDKDFIPLVAPGIGLLRPSGRGNDENWWDEREARRELGVRPAQYLDVLMLMGDSADNVPGVAGIGEKTALKLVSQFGSLEQLMGQLDDKRISPRQRKLLSEHREQFEWTRRVLSIQTHAPVGFAWNELQRTQPSHAAFKELCRELEFYSLLEQLAPAEQPSAAARHYRLIESLEALDTALASLRACEVCAVDTETTGLDPLRAELVGISLAGRAYEAIYIPVQVEADARLHGGLFGAPAQPRLPWAAVRDRLRPFLGGERPGKVGQNLKFDQLVLGAHGVELGGVVFDTMIASHLLAPERRQHSMDQLAAEVLGEETIRFKSLFEGIPSNDIRDVPLNRLATYAAEDADVTLRLYEAFAPQLVAEQLDHLMLDLEMPLSQVLLRMERRGVRLDLPLLAQLREEFSAELARLSAEIFELAGGPFNLNSPKQLQEVLFSPDRLGLKPMRRTTTGFSTDVDVLTQLANAHPLPAKLLEHRQIQKLLSTYVEALPKLVHPSTQAVHTSYNQAVAATGRLSSSDPNLQNIPIRSALGRRIREAFLPRQEGWLLLAADYSQIELRLMAHFSADEALCEAFRRGEDIHARTAAIVNGVELAAVDSDMRRRAKAINFGILYGMGARALGQSLGISTKDAQRFIDQYFERFARVRTWIDASIQTAHESREVRTILGRRRRLPELGSAEPRQRAFGERIAINTPIQGSAADLIKLAMLRIDAGVREADLPLHMLMQVHDELVFELPESDLARAEEFVREAMQNVLELRVPLVVDLAHGRNWAKAHP